MSTSSYINKPSTPLHPEANQEFELSQSAIPDNLKNALALDDSDFEDEESNAYIQLQEKSREAKFNGNDEDYDDDDDDDEVMSDVSEAELERQSYQNIRALSPTLTRVTSPGSNIDDNDNDITTLPTPVAGNFFDFNAQRRQPLNPFGANSNLTSSNPIRIKRRKSTINGEKQVPLQKLSTYQQTRLVNYIDDRLMNVQRKFIKYLSVRSEDGHVENNQTTSTSEIYYDLSNTITHLDEIITMLWYSIFKLKDIPLINHSNLFITSNSNIEENQVKQQELIDKIEKFEINPDLLITVGQPNYLIRIMGDLIDYLEKYALDTYNDILIVLQLLAKLDNIISVFIDADAPIEQYPASRLYDSYPDSDEDEEEGTRDFPKIKEETEDSSIFIDNGNDNSSKMINNTEKIRIESIVNRTRILLIQKFDKFRDLQKSKKRLNSGDDSIADLGLYELFIGEVYEGISDRVSI